MASQSQIASRAKNTHCTSSNFVTSPRKQRGFLNDDDTIASSDVTITVLLPLAQYYFKLLSLDEKWRKILDIRA
jgi:hypothetical protein